MLIERFFIVSVSSIYSKMLEIRILYINCYLNLILNSFFFVF